MRILAIETSCDETAVAVVEASGSEQDASFRVLGNALLSQIELHAQYGGVFPALAKREHAKNLVPLLEAALEEAELLHENEQELPHETHDEITQLLEREGSLSEALLEFLRDSEPPAIDAIAVTAWPGLEPALWVGINFAKALAKAWNKPVVAVNHMEGHILAALAQQEEPSTKHEAPNKDQTERLEIKNIELPLLALLISGGHTELVLMKDWLSYELVGQTRDDAVGEAFDKVARMMKLPYPGGPQISRLAEAMRAGPESEYERTYELPRPMLHDATCDFSFAGLKTAVLYALKTETELSETKKGRMAREFEDAVTEVLWKKTARALEDSGAQTLVLGGGVSANAHIRREFKKNVEASFPDVALRLPSAALTTDNAIMIALAGYYRALREEFATDITADGNRPIAAKKA